MDILFNPAPRLPHEEAVCGAFTRSAIAGVRAFHQTLDGYTPTPLHDLPQLARQLGLGQVLVKDEGKRFGLGAFKALGASFAMRAWAQRRPGEATPTFATATDGNHGRGVAWAARRLGAKAVVFLPKGSALARVAAIAAEGAQAIVTDANYDATVRLAKAQAEKEGWVLIQDTAWSGYTDVPLQIMLGYATLMAEALEQLGQAPTHVFLQAGVGSFAAAMIATLAALLAPDHPDQMPRLLIVEPQAAACFFASAQAGDGQAHTVEGDLATIMAGLACGQPSLLAWPILRAAPEAWLACPDDIALAGMRLLRHPLPPDPPIRAGASGAPGVGALAWLCQNPAARTARSRLGLDQASRVLLINTEAPLAGLPDDGVG